LTGIMEVSCGIKNLQSFTDAVYLPVVCSFLLGFGGLCVFCQTAAVVSDLSLKNYFWSKVKHGLVCAALTLLFLPVFSFLKTNTISKTEFTPTSSVMIANPGEVFSFSCGIAILFLIFLYFFHRSNKKRLFFFTPMRYDRKQKRNHRIYRCFFHNSNFIHSNYTIFFAEFQVLYEKFRQNFNIYITFYKTIVNGTKILYNYTIVNDFERQHKRRHIPWQRKRI